MAVHWHQDYDTGQQVVMRRAVSSQADTSFPITIAGWIKVNSGWSAADKVVCVLDEDGSSSDGIMISLGDQVGSTFKIQGLVRNFLFFDMVQSDALELGRWYHFAVRWSGSFLATLPTLMEIFVDGVLHDSMIPINDPGADPIDWFTIGGSRPDTSSTGAITDTCITHVARWWFKVGTDEIVELANGLPPTEGAAVLSLRDYFTMTEPDTVTVNEIGPDATLFELPPDGVLTLCVDEPFVGICPPETGCVTSGVDLTYPPCVTKWTQCVRIVRRDELTFRFTTLDRDFTFRGDDYLTCNSLITSAVQAFGELSEVGSTELSGILAAGAVDEADLYGGLFDDAFVEIWRVPYEGLDEPRRLGAGWVGKISQSARGYKMEVLGPGARLDQRPIVQTVTPQCRWTFGDTRCGVDVNALSVAGVVTSGTNRGIFLADIAEELTSGTGGVESSGALAPQYADGRIIWLTGVNAGQTTETKSVDFATGQVILWAQTAHVPEAGDTFDLLPGCAQDFPTCRDIYDNGRRFGGFPHVPGQDAIIKSPNVKQN